LGSQLRQIRLLAPLVEDYLTQYPEDGDNVVGKIRFEASTSTLEGFQTLPRLGKVYINDTVFILLHVLCLIDVSKVVYGGLSGVKSGFIDWLKPD
jgi:hypothetical protein